MALAEVTHRTAQAADLAAIQTLVRERYAAAAAAGVHPHDRPWYPSAGDLDWWRCTSSDPTQFDHIELWYAGDALVGFIWHNGDGAEVITHWHAQALYPTLLEWAEQRAATVQAVSDPGQPATYEEPLFARDDARRALLVARGYVPGERRAMQDHYFDLTQPLPPRRPLPAGFVLRTLAGEHELEARVAAHRAAFAPSGMTVAKHRCTLSAAMYRPDFDLVIEAPGWPAGAEAERDGAIAGYAGEQAQGPLFAAFTIVWYDEVNRMGVCEPVGCRPVFQRRGLAGAVVSEGLRRLREAGATHAWIGSWLDSAGDATYASLGSVRAQRHDFFTRIVTLAAP